MKYALRLLAIALGISLLSGCVATVPIKVAAKTTKLGVKTAKAGVKAGAAIIPNGSEQTDDGER